jgi:hypothetical protein
MIHRDPDPDGSRKAVAQALQVARLSVLEQARREASRPRSKYRKGVTPSSGVYPALVAARPAGEHRHVVPAIVHRLAAAGDATVSADDAAIMVQLDPARAEGLASLLGELRQHGERMAE